MYRVLQYFHFRLLNTPSPLHLLAIYHIKLFTLFLSLFYEIFLIIPNAAFSSYSVARWPVFPPGLSELYNICRSVAEDGRKLCLEFGWSSTVIFKVWLEV